MNFSTSNPSACLSPLFGLAVVLLVAFALGSPRALAITFPFDPENDVIGEMVHDTARHEQTLMDIARLHNLGYRDIRRANPNVSVWMPGEGSTIVIPTRFVLPDVVREGIVINRAEKRLYYFHNDPEDGFSVVTTHPIGIGRVDRQTPVGTATVSQKLDNPAWYPTDAVRADHASRGMYLPRMVPPGEDNPLGDHAILLDLPGYLIHGTNNPDGVGMRVSQGCIRLYPEDIRDLMPIVPVGTPVQIIDQPHKVGIEDGVLYVEIHPGSYRESEGGPGRTELFEAVGRMLALRGDELHGAVDWDLIEKVLERADGVPVAVSGGSRGIETVGR